MNLTRKELARRSGLSAQSIRRNETKLGLRPVRVNKRLVVYAASAALHALRSRGLEM